ncbi:hypothetical protein [Tranquillimonas alkanivorans]|uniref:50S ribosomal protein L35 n=1 Tax=Tranquillimonas alkanivorans TaxID=441119 RepID=A0A1I5KTZ4_9RHOB|nr:hypothetical protein [Tranquillimonas alkanivorans]SFO88398.1 hypothetical protein SAMN04488047_101305 [Tranquillimonas alkanivorans]
MQPDLALVVGGVCLALAIPSVIAAFTDSRPPRAAAILFVIGGGFVAYAVNTKPGGYTFEDVPDAVVRVVAQYTR